TLSRLELAGFIYGPRTLTVTDSLHANGGSLQIPTVSQGALNGSLFIGSTFANEGSGTLDEILGDNFFEPRAPKFTNSPKASLEIGGAFLCGIELNNYGTLRITDFSRSRFPVTTTDCGFPTVTTTFNNFGRIDIQGGTLQLAGSGFVAGSVNASADSILLFAGSTSGTYTLKDGLVFSGPGAFQLGNGGSAVVEGTIKGTMIELFGGRL